MGRSIKRGIKYIVNGTPEYNIHVTPAFLTDETYLKGRIILITGGSKGIGFAIASKVIKSGGKAIITGRNKKDLEKAKNRLGNDLYTYVLDNSNPHDFDLFFERVTKEVGIIDSLVNNAGVSFHEPSFEDVTVEDFDTQININLRGTYFMSQSFIKYYRKNNIKKGVIINISSETAGYPTYRPYGMTKAAIVTFSRWLAQKYILEGLRVNTIAPGVTETNMTNYVTKGKTLYEDSIGKRTIMPEEIAEVCCFLLSDMASCISGQIIACNEANVLFDN